MSLSEGINDAGKAIGMMITLVVTIVVAYAVLEVLRDAFTGTGVDTSYIEQSRGQINFLVAMFLIVGGIGGLITFMKGLVHSS
jgi:phosphate/sulfate permease